MDSVNEPWWFFDGWRSEITFEENFVNFSDARAVYELLWSEMATVYMDHETRLSSLSAFLNPNEMMWCDACDEYLQRYHGLALLEDYATISPSVTKNNAPQICKIKEMREH